MVKEFDPDRSNYAFKDIWIVLDMHRDSQLGEGDDATGEYSITVAASLAKKYLDSGKQVGLIAAGDRPYLFPPDTGEAHLEALLRALALMQATGNKPIEALLASEVDRFDAGSAVIVVLPSRGQGITVPLRRAINRGTVVTAILLDSRSFGGETGTATAAVDINQRFGPGAAFGLRLNAALAQLDPKLRNADGMPVGSAPRPTQ